MRPAAGVVVDGVPVAGVRAQAIARWAAEHAAELEALEFGWMHVDISPGELKPGLYVKDAPIKARPRPRAAILTPEDPA